MFIKHKTPFCVAVALLTLLLGLAFKADAFAAQEKTKVKVAAQATSGQVFHYLAEDRGYLADEGLDVEIVYINNGSDAFAALGAGKVDVLSTYGTSGPLVFIANGQPFSMFAGYMVTGATPVFARPQTVYKGVESLIGKKIAIMRGGTPDVVLKGILHDAGYDPLKDVTFVELKRNQEVIEAVRSGQVDFGSVSTGFELQIKESGLNIVMWPDEVWERHSCCRMLSGTAWMLKNKGTLEKLLRAYLRAEKDMQDAASMERVIALTSKTLNMSDAIVRSFVLSPHILYETDPYKQSVLAMWRKMKAFGYIPDNSPVNIEEHINVEIYKNALESLIAEYPNEAFYQTRLKNFTQYNL